MTKADDGGIDAAVDALRAGHVVAIPTETVYGLAADASNAEAVARIYRTKGRPDFNPLIVHVPDHATVETTGINQVRIVWQPQPVLVG